MSAWPRHPLLNSVSKWAQPCALAVVAVSGAGRRGAGAEKASLRNLAADFGFCLGRMRGLQAAMRGKAEEGFSQLGRDMPPWKTKKSIQPTEMCLGEGGIG